MLRLGKFMVNWQHFNPLQDRVIVDKFERKYVRQIPNKEFFGTKCFIHEGEKNGDEPLVIKVVGISKLHRYENYDWSAPKGGHGYDIFNKEIGRKISLENALSQIKDLTKDDRAIIWEDYINRDLIKNLF